MQSTMSQGFIPHYATVTATATVAYETVDHHNDVFTIPYSQNFMTSAVESDQSVSSFHFQTGLHENTTSTSMQQAACYPSSGTVQSYLPGSSSVSLSTAYDIPQSAVYENGCYENIENRDYFAPNLLVSAASSFGFNNEGDFANNFDGVGDYPDHEHLPDSFYRRGYDSNIDVAFKTSAASWNQYDWYTHDEEETVQSRYRDQTTDCKQHHEGQGDVYRNVNSLVLGTATEQKNSEPHQTASQCVSTIPDTQSFNTSTYRTLESAHQNMMKAGNLFQENCTHDPNWYETDIDDCNCQQSHSSKLLHYSTTDSNYDIGVREINNSGQDCIQSQCSMEQNKSTHKQLFGICDEEVHQQPEETNLQTNEIQALGNMQDVYQNGEAGMYTTPDSSKDADDNINGVNVIQRHQEREQMARPAHCQLYPVMPASHGQEPDTIAVSPRQSEHNKDQQPLPLMSHQQSFPSSCTGAPICRSKQTSDSNIQTIPSPLTVAAIPNTTQTQPQRPDPCSSSSHNPVAQSPTKTPDSSCIYASSVGHDESSSVSSPSSNSRPLIDVDYLLSSGVTVAGFKPRPIIRKRRKVMIPPVKKDTSYWHKRKKNNDSAKRSREAKKQKEKNFYRRALELEYENYFLKERLGQVEAQLQAVTGVTSSSHDYVVPDPSEYVSVNVRPDGVFM